MTLLLALGCFLFSGEEDDAMIDNADNADNAEGADAPEIESIDADCEDNGVVVIEVRTSGEVDSVTVQIFDEADDLGIYDLDEGASDRWFVDITPAEMGRPCQNGFDAEYIAEGPGGTDETVSAIF